MNVIPETSHLPFLGNYPRSRFLGKICGEQKVGKKKRDVRCEKVGFFWGGSRCVCWPLQPGPESVLVR